MRLTSIESSFHLCKVAFTPAQHVARQQVARTSNMLRATSCLLPATSCLLPATCCLYLGNIIMNINEWQQFFDGNKWSEQP